MILIVDGIDGRHSFSIARWFSKNSLFIRTYVSMYNTIDGILMYDNYKYLGNCLGFQRQLKIRYFYY